MAGTRSYMLSLTPKVLRWARRRTRMAPADLAAKIGVPPEKVADWEETGSISREEADQLAAATRTAYGYLLMSTTPDEDLQVADFRTVGSARLQEPSPELFDTLMTMLGRKEWAHEERVDAGREELKFVGSRDMATAQPDTVAADMRTVLGLAEDWQASLKQAAARKLLFERMDQAGVVVCVNGIVRNNTHRALDPREFRGFALADSHAPAVFVNGNDSYAGQIFTLAHEFAHIIIGEGGVSSWDFESARPRIETFCNKAAAEFLVPKASVERLCENIKVEDDIIQIVSQHYCVSPIVAAYRMKELNVISASVFKMEHSKYDAWAEPGKHDNTGGSGGSFWSNQTFRIGHGFGKEVVQALQAGRMLYREAWDLTGLDGDAFDTYVSMCSDDQQ